MADVGVHEVRALGALPPRPLQHGVLVHLLVDQPADLAQARQRGLDPQRVSRHVLQQEDDEGGHAVQYAGSCTRVGRGSQF